MCLLVTAVHNESCPMFTQELTRPQNNLWAELCMVTGSEVVIVSF